jgi:hypothetical protein
MSKFKTVLVKISSIKPNENNPRIIKDDKFKSLVQSVTDFPEMLEIRPIVVNEDGIIIGGNMRYRACLEAGITEVPVIKLVGMSQEKQNEFLIKDNVAGGEWDWDALANNWDSEDLKDWGLQVWQTNLEDMNFDSTAKATKEEKEKDNSPRTTDDNYSTFELIMLHENKLDLLDTLNKVKNEFLFEKQEDALMEILRVYNKK